MNISHKILLTISCLLFICNFNLTMAQNEKISVKISEKDIISPSFGGVGFNSFHHSHNIDERMWNEVVYKRWRELAPTFVRLSISSRGTKEYLDNYAKHLQEYKQTGTEVYVISGAVQAVYDPDSLKRYVSQVVDGIEYLIRDKKFTNIKYYCMSNELSLKGWASLVKDMPTFKRYHEAFFKEFASRNLDVKLLASDASPINYWRTISWCAENMDEITGIYGGHHYINEHLLTDKSFYGWFYTKNKWAVDIAKSKGKNFILGEFGAKQNRIIKLINGQNVDKNEYYDTKLEALAGIQVVEAIIAAINAGDYALGYWTFMDFPNAEPVGRGENKWGLTRWNGKDNGTRDPYYAVGLMSRYFGGGGVIYRAVASDTLIHVAAIKHNKGTWSIAVISRKDKPIAISLELPVGEKLTFRKYIYDPSNVPQNIFGDLQAPSGELTVKSNKFEDIVEGMSVVVYTTDYDNIPPRAVKNIQVKYAQDKNVVTWDANTEEDICYYRVFKSSSPNFTPSINTQKVSTIALSYTDELPAERKFYYKVLAVDRYGNALVK